MAQNGSKGVKTRLKRFKNDGVVGGAASPALQLLLLPPQPPEQTAIVAVIGGC